MANKNQYTAQEFIEAIAGSGGVISVIARRVGCEWNTAKKYIDTYPTVAQAYANEFESTLDAAESAILKGITEGNTQDAKWYLSRKGVKRGYADKQELTHSGPSGGPIAASISIVDDDNAAEVFNILKSIGAFDDSESDGE